MNQKYPDVNYVVVTPVRDEEAYLRFTLDSMVAQTVRPREWVIVNDGSTDNTGSIIDEYAAKHSWIRHVPRGNRGFRKTGGGVVEAFYEGYHQLQTTDWDYIIKLDGDLSFGPDYFARSFARFDEDPKLGIGGPYLYHILNGVRELEKCPEFHVRGAAKLIRRACWEAIGGFWVGMGWDTLDEVKANMLGWKSRSFPEIEILHHRYTGEASGKWGNMVNYGKGDYATGYHPLFMLGKCAIRLMQPPYIMGSIGIMYGFLSGYLRKLPRIEDREVIRYVRRQQMARMFGGASIWK
jgi:glycosyltransferase involved in cell wall biosynthesis